MNLHLVFVYGSLKRGERHHGELAGARYVGPARAFGARLVEYVEGYPALVPAGGAEAEAARAGNDPAAVNGELYEVDSALLARLDEFEDCPTLYQRALIEVAAEVASGAPTTRSAEAYVIDAVVAAEFRTIHGTWSPE